MKNEQLGAICSEQIAISKTYAGAVVRDDIAASLRMFQGEPLGNEQKGRSSIVSNDLSDMTDAVIAQLQPGLQSSWGEFEEISQGDAEQAQAESVAVNSLIQADNKGFIMGQTAAMDALMTANGTIKVYVSEKEVTEVKRFMGLVPEEVAMLEAQGATLVSTDEDTGEQEFTMTVPEQKLIIERVAPENLLVDPNQTTFTYEDTSWIAERCLLTRSDLVEMGYNKKMVSMLTAHTLDKEIDEQARLVGGQDDPSSQATTDRDLIEVFECHMRFTADGKTGISELWKVMYCDQSNTVLGKERCDFVPYATGAPFIMPGRWAGRSLYNKLADITLGKTRVLRQWIDSNEAVLNARKYVNANMVNMDDLLTSRVNGVVRVKGSPHEAVMIEPVADVATSAMALLEYFDKLRSERCGAAMDSMNPETQGFATVSGTSAEIQLSSMEMMSSMIAKTISTTLLRSVMILTHETLRRKWKGPISIKIRGDWQEVDPSQWQPRTELTMKVGVSPGERGKKASALNQQLAYQLQLMQAGGANIMVNLNNVHRLLLDLGAAQGLTNIDNYWVDPESQASMQAQQGMQQNQQQQMQMQMQAQQMAMQLEQQRVEIDKLKVEYDRLDDIEDNEHQRNELAAKIEIEEAKLVQQGINEVRKAQASGTAGEGRARDSQAA